jgi:hypothetical protein
MGMQTGRRIYMTEDIWDEAISELASRLAKAPDGFTPEQIYPCPVCEHQLNIQIGRYQRSGTKMIGITIECDQCDNAIASDHVEE